MCKKYTVEFTKEELDALLIQVGARVDSLKQAQKDAGKSENIERVLQLEKFMQPIISGKEKMEKERYRY